MSNRQTGDLTTDLLSQIMEVYNLDVTARHEEILTLRKKFELLIAAQLSAAEARGKAAGAREAVTKVTKQHLAAVVLSGMVVSLDKPMDSVVDAAIEAAGIIIDKV